VRSVVDHGTTRDGLVQLRRRWSSKGPARAAILLVHGIAEHSGRYEHVGSALADRGFDVVAIDLRGFGESGGRRGHVDEFSQFLDDVEDQLAELRKLALPTVLLAHSMGGLIATAYCVDGRPLPDYLVLSGPALGYDLSLKEKLLTTLVPVLRRVTPTLEVRQPPDPSVLSTDPTVGEIFYADPLRVPYPTVMLGSELRAAMLSTVEDIDRLTVPTLCFHGGDDWLVPTEASAVLETLPNVERFVLEGMRHEVFNEPGGLEVVHRIADWLDERLL
jgi:acylglycerol lipase